MTFRQISSVVSFLFISLSVTLIVLPDIIYWLFQIEGAASADFIAKRAGVLFLGLSILAFHARNTQASEVKRLVAVSIGTAMAALAVLGTFELMRGNAGFGILLAIVIEIIIAYYYYRVWVGRID